jgi:putative membrane protein insertion efficiency factor
MLYNFNCRVRKEILSFMLVGITFYKKAISPFIPVSCRHSPTCSEYAYEALLKYGLKKGAYLSTKRILRCRPLGSKGYDPIP